MGGGNERRSDKGAPGSERSSEQNPANPKATKCNASVPVPERNGRCTATHQDVCRIHDLLPEWGFMQHVH